MDQSKEILATLASIASSLQMCVDLLIINASPENIVQSNLVNLCDKLSPSKAKKVFCEAVRRNRPDFVHQLINVGNYRGERVDPSMEDNAALVWAIQEKSTEVLAQLLADPRVDPSAQHNYAINRAVFYSNNKDVVEDVVDILLRDSRVDPSANNNVVLKQACDSGHWAIVKRLAQDPRIDLSARNNCAIHAAFVNKNYDEVDWLMKDNRVRAGVLSPELREYMFNKGVITDDDPKTTTADDSVTKSAQGETAPSVTPSVAPSVAPSMTQPATGTSWFSW